LSTETYADLPLAGTLIADGYQGWSSELRREFEINAFNGHVGQVLLSETERLRVWEIRLQPGERVGAHRHVLDYFWTALAPGRSRQHTSDGTTREVAYHRGQTRHFTFAEGQYLLHDLENIGDEPLAFLTVELKESANRPLPL
jgi:mannose-6-phosphate isomerase-like protein (cupin superfamily)